MQKPKLPEKSKIDSVIDELPWDNLTETLDANFIYKYKLTTNNIKFIANPKNSHYLIEIAFKDLKKTNPQEATLTYALQLTDVLQNWARNALVEMQKTEKELVSKS